MARLRSYFRRCGPIDRRMTQPLTGGWRYARLPEAFDLTCQAGISWSSAWLCEDVEAAAKVDATVAGSPCRGGGEPAGTPRPRYRILAEWTRAGTSYGAQADHHGGTQACYRTAHPVQDDTRISAEVRVEGHLPSRHRSRSSRRWPASWPNRKRWRWATRPSPSGCRMMLRQLRTGFRTARHLEEPLAGLILLEWGYTPPP